MRKKQSEDYSLNFSIQYLCKHDDIRLISNQASIPALCEHDFELQLDLGHRVLIFASRTNLDSGPRFTKVCHLLVAKKSPANFLRLREVNKFFWHTFYFGMIALKLTLLSRRIDIGHNLLIV